jgi:hypothetical protein
MLRRRRTLRCCQRLQGCRPLPAAGRKRLGAGHRSLLTVLGQFTLNSALSILAGCALGSDAPATAISKLARAGEVSCRPALPFFCGNIHIGCSGLSTIPTFPFKLRATSGRALIESEADTSGIGALYQDGRVEWGGDDTYIIVRPRRSNGYIKIFADGTYSFRHYSQDAATMSHGHCH